MAFDVRTLSGITLVDAAGATIGTVAQVYLDDRTEEPEWVTVRTGPGPAERFVPLASAHLAGDRLVVDASRDVVAGAPEVPADGHISGRQEAEIYRYYLTGRSTPGTSDAGRAAPGTADVRAAGPGESGRGGSGPGESGTDAAMTRSEEHLVAGTRREPTERVRLRRYVVTEMETVQVPVRREEVRLEHEPITDAEREAAYAGGKVSDITEVTDVGAEEREMILRAERPVVSTETVPVERVRLGTETVTDTETVSGPVRREQIAVDDPTGTARER